eukprot:RCo017355
MFARGSAWLFPSPTEARSASPYAVLGLAPGATVNEIKARYHALSLQYHPDRCGGSDTRFKEITLAYEALRTEASAREKGTPAGDRTPRASDSSSSREGQSDARRPNPGRRQQPPPPWERASWDSATDDWAGRRFKYGAEYVNPDSAREFAQPSSGWAARDQRFLRNYLGVGLAIIVLSYYISRKEARDQKRRLQRLEELREEHERRARLAREAAPAVEQSERPPISGAQEVT